MGLRQNFANFTTIANFLLNFLRKLLSNAYFLAKIRFDTAENEPAKNSQIFCKILQKRSVDEQDNCGRSVLLWAVYKGHRKIVQWILARGGKIGHRDHENMTALHWLAAKGHALG